MPIRPRASRAAGLVAASLFLCAVPASAQKAATTGAKLPCAVGHRANGVARIVANGLSKAQTTAIAKAVATP